MVFFCKLADWLEVLAAGCINFGLSKQAFNALNLTLCLHSMVIQDLFADVCSKLQVLTLPCHEWWKVLCKPAQVESSGKIMKCFSSLKVKHNCWLDNEGYGENENLDENTNKLFAILEEKEERILEATL